MELFNLVKTTEKSKKRVGRGIGSGRGGHTSGRGQKGEKARGKLRLYFEGASVGASLIKKLPLLRGKKKHKSLKKNPVIVNLKYLNLLPAGSIVDLPTLIKYKIVDEKEAHKYGVKILGEGELKIPLVIKLPCSISAREKVEKFVKENPTKENRPPSKKDKVRIRTKKAKT